MTEKGFQKANSGNLPCVDMLMVANFFMNSDKFVGAELKGVKNSRAGRESYGDDAVGYVQVQRLGTICTVKARVTPEHRVRSKCYSVQLTIDEANATVTNNECFDCAASTGGCKHAIALLMWVHRRSEDPAPTSVECYWKKSKLSKVGTSLKFVLSSELGAHTSGGSQKPKPSKAGTFLSSVLLRGANSNCQGQIFQHYRPVQHHEYLCLHNQAFWFVQNGGTSMEEFLVQCNFHMTKARCDDIAEQTAMQCEESLWHDLRFGRITASKVYEASRCKTFNGSLTECVLGAKIKDNKYLKRGRGRELEPLVLAEVEKMVNQKFKKIGVLLSANYPAIGASPDAICEDFVVEVKCPFSAKTVSNYVSKGTLTPKCKGQIHLQMLMSGKKEGLFCVADVDFESNKKVDLHRVTFDELYTETLVNDAMEFWEKAIFPKLLAIK